MRSQPRLNAPAGFACKKTHALLVLEDLAATAAVVSKMNGKRVSTDGSEAMVNVAEHYSAELNAQFRTLNHFVGHAGEIGRAHETFLRGILKRFLPNSVRLTSGFFAHPNWTSRQQDILIHNRDIPTLFEVGDCTVVNHKAFVGTIEVKTQLTKKGSFRSS